MTENRISTPALRSPVAPVTRVTFVIVPRFNMATLISLIEPLRIANYLAPEPLYQWEILSPDGPEIPASNGLRAGWRLRESWGIPSWSDF